MILVASSFAALAGSAAGEEQAKQLYEFADRLRSEGLHKTAIPQFEKFLASHPQHELAADALFRLGECHFELKLYPQAIVYFTELTSKHPDKPLYVQAMQRLGHSKLLGGDLDGSIATLTDVLSKNPAKELLQGTQYLLGKAYYLKQDFRKSYEVMSVLGRDAAPENKYRAMALVMAGDAALRLQQPNEAVAAFTTFLEVDPKSPERDEVLIRTADSYRSMKKYEEASRYYLQVSAGSVFSPAGIEGGARALLMLGKYDDALKHAGELLAKHPNDPLVPSAMQVAGFCHYEKGQFDQAAAQLGKLVQAYPKSELAESSAHKLCWAWYRLGQGRQADVLAACNFFLQTYPESKLAGDAFFLLGEAHYWAKDYPKAIEYYANVPKENPSHRAARVLIAVCQEDAGDLKKSLETLTAFAAEFPNTPEAESAMQRSVNLLLLTKDNAGAEKKCNDYLAAYPNGKYVGDATYLKAESMRMQGRYDEMSATFRQYLGMAGPPERKGQAHYWIARAAQAKGDGARADAMNEKGEVLAGELNKQAVQRFQEAMQDYQACAKLGGDAAKLVPARLAESHYSIGSAIAANAQALQNSARKVETEQNKESATPLYEQAAALQAQSKASFRAAADLFHQVMMADPKLVPNQRAVIWAGAFFQAEKDRDKALAIFNKLLKTDPTSPFADRALHQLGELYADDPQPDWAKSYEYFAQLANRYAEALKTNAKAQTPLLHNARYGMARALRFQKRFDEAAKLLEEVLARVPDGERLNASAALQLAHVQYARGELARARDIFGRVGLLYEDDQITPEALFMAGKATVDGGEVMDGAKMWALLIRKYPAARWAELAEKELRNRGIVRDAEGNIKQ